MIEQYFFELLQVAIGNRSGLSAIPSDVEWQALYGLSKKQALVGITFKGCEKLPESQRPPLVLFLKWLGMANRVKERNAVLNQECCEVTEELENAGIHSVVLKGQSNRWNYGDELCDYRSPGDIDLWTWTDEGGIGSIVEYTKQHRLAHGLPVMPWHRILYYHVESQTAQGTEVELHYRPSYLNCLWRNRRLQRWFVDEGLRIKDERLGMKDEEIKDFPIPSNSFNAVYQLLHIYKHLFEEGIGLRQMVECSRKTTLADWDEQLKGVMGSAEAGAVTYTAAMNEGERYIADSIKAAGYPLVLLMKYGFPPVGSEEEKKYKPGGLMSDICSQGRLLLLEAYPESYEDPRIVEMTERSLTQKAEAKGFRYKELPHASLRWRSIACNEMMRMVVTN